jgi:hypothetical protein
MIEQSKNKKMNLIHDLRKSVRRLKLILDALEGFDKNPSISSAEVRKVKSDFQNEINELTVIWNRDNLLF